jgi:hypothetical protein
MADDDGVGLAQRPDHAGRVGRRGNQVVAAGRLVAAAVPAQVGGHRPVTGGRQRFELCPPGPPELREPVQQQDQRPLAGLRDMESGAVGSDRAV